MNAYFAPPTDVTGSIWRKSKKEETTNMAISHEEVMAGLSDEMRARVEARTQELIEEEMTLRDLRSVQHLTQERVAKILGVEQDSVSRMERRADMLLSTMSSYVEAMGGRLRLVAEFPNRRPYTVRLGDLSNAVSKPRRRGQRGLPGTS